MSPFKNYWNGFSLYINQSWNIKKLCAILNILLFRTSFRVSFVWVDLNRSWIRNHSPIQSNARVFHRIFQWNTYFGNQYAFLCCNRFVRFSNVMCVCAVATAMSAKAITGKLCRRLSNSLHWLRLCWVCVLLRWKFGWLKGLRCIRCIITYFHIVTARYIRTVQTILIAASHIHTTLLSS